ncbi:MAG: TIGR02710 family CRISPR-associated CARF protein [Candidatus Kryptonium sp.]|nr:TIGR02710 family CRISPR-associated CARF protein [Candidatus Kryptonium sp.]MDW8108709.1 TIGR02710 family CRISPR-associated CARF protein [Candidatus Kryptonium sp.]
MGQEAKKVVMFVTVGTGRDRADIASAIVKSIRSYNPNIVVFLCTEKSKQETLPIIEEGLAKENITVEQEIKLIKDENDLEAVKQICSNEMRKFERDRKFVEYTSGTKAMSVGLVLAGLENGAEKFSYIAGNRDETGRVIPGTERFISFEPTVIYAEVFFKKAIEYFNDGMYGSASKMFEKCLEIYREESFKKKVETLNNLCKVYQNWDLFKHKEAFETAKEIDLDILAEFEAKRKFESNRDSLAFLNKESVFSPLKAIDLLRNAERRIERERYDDAVARLYRLLEYIIQIGIDKLGLYSEPGKIDLSKLPDDLKEKYQRSEIALAKSAELLNDLGDEMGKELYESITQGNLKKILSARNNSILAHGFTPIDKETAEEFRDILKKILAKYFGSDFERWYEDLEFVKLKVL